MSAWCERASAGCVLSKVLLKRAGSGACSFLQVHETASAAHAIGARSQLLEDMINAGNAGSAPQNLERDIYRLVRRCFGTDLDFYEVEVTVKKRQGRLSVGTVKWAILCPHEIFAACHSHKRGVFDSVFGCEPEHVSFWRHQLSLNEEWLRCHPFGWAAQRFPHLTMPYRLFGDDTGLSKNCERPCSLLHFYAVGSSVPVPVRKIPILAMPTHLQVKGVTMTQLHSAVK